MREHIKFMIKGVVLTALIILLLFMLNRILIPKFFYNTEWAATSTYTGFYEMEKDTIDILFLGSSHGVSSFSPQVIYNEYGLRSYNLSGEQQNLLVSYYWLKEALRYQRPKAVVLDTYLCFLYSVSEPLNSEEPATRKAIDYMKWSSIKTEAIDAICTNDENQSKSSYYFPNIRFHSRWTDLKEDDFTSFELDNHYELKGYYFLPNAIQNTDYQPFTAGSSDYREDMFPLMKEYLIKITQLCKEQNIPLILVSTPSTHVNEGRYNTIRDFAAENELSYYDFNVQELYNEIGFDFAEDCQDTGHLNYKGARKISVKLGAILLNDYEIQPISDSQWEESREFYDYLIANQELKDITDIYQYLKAIHKDRYSIFIGVKDDASLSLNDEIIRLMQELGLEFPLRDQFHSSYYAAITPEGVVEEMSTEKITMRSSFRSGRSSYEIISAGYECGNLCYITVDDYGCSRNRRGLNIVVYDNLYHKVVDSVCFDTYDAAHPCSR